MADTRNSIDFRATHNALRCEIVRGAMMWMIGSMATFILWIGLAAHRGMQIALVDLVGLAITIAPIFVLLYVLLALRAIVARSDGLEVDGELVPWHATTPPKIAFLSRSMGASNPARAWIRVAGRGWTSALVLIADPMIIDALARMRAAALVPQTPAPLPLPVKAPPPPPPPPPVAEPTGRTSTLPSVPCPNIVSYPTSSPSGETPTHPVAPRRRDRAEHRAA